MPTASLLQSLSADGNAFMLSFTMVSMAEVFDKTWFVALVMAMRYEKNTVFWSCFVALLLHVLLAAAFGYSISHLLSPSRLNFLAAAIYGTFTMLYLYDWHSSARDTDVIAAGREEAAQEFGGQGLAVEAHSLYGAVKHEKPTRADTLHLRRIFCQCFTAVFFAEFGDRTQIAMIGVHASQPLVPVMLGSAAAFGMLTLSAVMLGMFIGDRTLSESLVKGICAISFAVFTALAIHDGLLARAQEVHVAF